MVGQAQLLNKNNNQTVDGTPCLPEGILPREVLLMS